MKSFGLCLKEKNNTTHCPQVLNMIYDSLVKYYFWLFQYMNTRL